MLRDTDFTKYITLESKKMKIKNIYFDETARLYMLIESAIFGDNIANKKLGFYGLDTQVTFIPSVWSGTPFSLKKLGEGRLLLDPTKAPLQYNQMKACDIDCPHLVRSLRKEEYQNEKGCYVKQSSLIFKVRKVHKNPIIERTLPPKSYNFRLSVWGDVSAIQDKKIMYLLRALMLNAKQHFAYSVNPPPLLKDLIMKSESKPLSAYNSLMKGQSVYFGNKSTQDQDMLKSMIAGIAPAIKCRSLGDGNPYLPTCGSCKTPCDGQAIKGKPKLILASRKEDLIPFLKLKA